MKDSSQTIYQALKNAGINFVVSLPCVNLGKLMEMVECDSDVIHVPVNRELIWEVRKLLF
jgi:sulfopyruvate decarboxylase subunit alpha